MRIARGTVAAVVLIAAVQLLILAITSLLLRVGIGHWVMEPWGTKVAIVLSPAS